MIKIFIYILLLLILSLNASENQDTTSLKKVTLQLQWKYQFQFAGFIVAKEKGYYKDVGLDVELLEYDNTNTIKDLENSKVDFVINNSTIVYKNQKINDVVLLATYFQRSPLVLIAQKNIKSINDVKGKTIMVSENNLYNSSLSMMFDHFSINKENTTFIKPSFNIQDFINKKVDVISAFKSNEIFTLDSNHIEYTIIDPIEYGFSTNAINLFTSQKILKENPKLIDKFLEANKKGWKYALNHIDEIATLIHKKYAPNKSLELLKYEAKITKELMLTNLYDIGEVNKEFVYSTYKYLLKTKKILNKQKIKKHIYTPPNHGKIELTKEEEQWIKENPVITYSEINWKPLSIINNNHISGIIGDYLEKVSHLSGIKFKYIASNSWPEVLQKFKDKKIDLVPGVGSSDQEIELGLASDIFASYPMVVVTGTQYNFLDSLKDLKNKTIAVPKYYTSYNFILNNYPNLKLLTTKNIEEALLLVESGEADAFVGHIATSLDSIAKLSLKNLKISGTTKFIFEHRFLIQNNNPILLSIINKSFAAISEQEKSTINKNWIQTKVEKGIDKTLIIKMIIAFVVILLLFMYRHYSLNKYTKKIKELQERHEIAVKNGSIGIVDFDVVNNKIFFSSSWKNMLGYQDNEISNTLDELINRLHKDEAEEVLSEMQLVKKIKKTYVEGQHRLRHKDGHYIWILYRLKIDYKHNEVVRMLGIHTDITTQKNLEQELINQKNILNHQAHYDALTNLPNRVLFQDRLNQAIEKVKRNNKKMALFFIDLDHFKEINDSLGHSIGDKVLVEITKRLKSVIRKEDTLARLGGDEFTVVIEDLEKAHEASSLAQKIIKSLVLPLNIDEHVLYISCSIGISVYPDDGLTYIDLLKYSDAAMYKAKDEGRNNFQFYSMDMTETALEKITLEASLRKALKNKEFVVYYQAQVDAQNNKLIGMEALVRWQNPILGLIPPSKFIPLAESTGLIIPLDQFVMKEAISQIVKWHKDGLNPGTLSLNLAMKQLEQKDFIELLQTMLQDLDCQANWIELEVVESQIMNNPKYAIETLTKINSLGIKLSIDDFGTGYSSLSYLKKLPINKLKIDRSFIMDLPDDEDDVGITKAVIALAKSLNLNIIAEGVENKEQKEFLIANGCNNIQGYYYSRPVPANEMLSILKNGL